MVVGEVAERADVVVVGAGPGGYTVALRAAAEGRSVTLIERDAIGGVCLNVGCIPSKALLEVADTVHRARTSQPHGVIVGGVQVDGAALAAHLAHVVSDLTGGIGRLLDSAGVTRLAGTARLVRPDRLVIDEGVHVRHLEFESLVLATGSRPATLPILALDGDTVVDSTGLLAAMDVAARVCIVGGGYIGVELGTALAKLGAAVTLVEAAERVLPGMDPLLSRAAASGLTRLGVRVLTGSTVLGRDGDALVVRVGNDAGRSGETREETGEERIPTDRIVVAVGRRPNSDDLGLEHTAVAVGAGGLIEVDASRRAAPGIFALGDLTAGPALAHKAMAEAQVVAEVLAGRAARFDPAAIPLVVFGEPEIASVGLTTPQATAAGYAARATRFPLSASGRARILGRTEGFVQVVADEAGTILGIHLAGPHVSELASAAALAVEMAATVEDLALTVLPHPTIGEALGEAASASLARQARPVTAARTDR